MQYGLYAIWVKHRVPSHDSPTLHIFIINYPLQLVKMNLIGQFYDFCNLRVKISIRPGVCTKKNFGSDPEPI